jgi:hypothetical protein
MNNELLICGSAIAVVVLVLASFSPVVGYNSVESSAKDSPLFRVRTNKAIDKQSDRFICKYIGNGELIPFPEQDRKVALLQKIVDGISGMDNTEFTKLKELVISYIQKNDAISTEKIPDVIKALDLLRNSPFTIKDFIGGEENDNGATSSPEYTVCHWRPGCLLWIINEIIITIFLDIYMIGITIILYLVILYSVFTDCPTFGDPSACSPCGGCGLLMTM